jgi:predicted anti-sigma-YlaC factor YlaD
MTHYTSEKHPDVVPYAQDDLPATQRAEIERHLAECGECRDLVLFIRKTNATLRYEGRVSRVAKALGISVEQLNREIVWAQVLLLW